MHSFMPAANSVTWYTHLVGATRYPASTLCCSWCAAMHADVVRIDRGVDSAAALPKLTRYGTVCDHCDAVIGYSV
jgi:hypothetical protein